MAPSSCSLAVLLVAAMLSLHPVPTLSAPRPKARQVAYAWNSLRRQCETGFCKQFIEAGRAVGEDIDIKHSCLDYCQAPRCYEQVYGAEPLEAGEIDRDRALQFTICTRQFERELRSAGLWPPRLNETTGVLLQPTPVLVDVEAATPAP